MKENTKEKIDEPFFIVPSRVFELELSPYELTVLFYLMMRADNQTHTCFPSEKGIARACGMSLASVKRTVKSLLEKQLIDVNKQFTQSKNGLNRQTANLYIIQLCRTPPDAQTDTHPSSVRHSPQLTQIREINKTIPNITKTNITISTELREVVERVPKMEFCAEKAKNIKKYFRFKKKCLDK